VHNRTRMMASVTGDDAKGVGATNMQ